MDDQKFGIVSDSRGDSSSQLSQPSPSPSSATCWATHVTAAAVSVAVAWPLGKALLHMVERGQYDKPFYATVLALAVAAAPASVWPGVLELARRFAPGGGGK